MEAVFIKLLNMSITAGYLVLAVVLLRLLLKKAPKAIFVAMWALVGLRLIFPFSVESILSLIPSAEPVPENIAYAPVPAIHSGVQIFNSVVNPVLQQSFTPSPGASVNPMQIVLRIASVVWAVGVAVLLGYCVFSYLSIHRKVREAAYLKDRIWLCDRISTPFILGLFRPKIYLPSSMNEQDMEYVLAHENAHLKRRDHLWKPLGFLLLAVYWFNPLMWLAYVLLCRDIELACDEKVLTQMGSEAKKPYSEALLNCSIKPHMIAACPLAFGEVGVKKRIKSILNYKKPAFWILLVALVLCVVLAVCLLTDPKSDTKKQPFQQGITTPSLQSGELRKKYPQYFGLDASGGLDVYVWQMAKGSYSFGVLPHSEEKLDRMSPELMNLPGATDYEMRRILSSYDLDESSIYIIPWQNPLSSYIPEIWIADSNMTPEQKQAKIDAYIAIVKMLLGPMGGSKELYTIPVYKEMVFDIDGDGVLEECSISNGLASGFNSIIINVYQNGYLEYEEAFFIDSLECGFAQDENGNVFFLLKDDIIQHGFRYDIEVEEGEIRLLGEYFQEMVSKMPMAPFFTGRYVEAVEYDIDNDGVVETCGWGYGPTSGVFTFTISVWENDRLEYYSIFQSKHYSLSFKEDSNHVIYLQGTTQGDDPQKVRMDLSVEDGNIVVTLGGERLGHWQNWQNGQVRFINEDQNSLQYIYVKEYHKSITSIANFRPSLNALRHLLPVYYVKTTDYGYTILFNTDKGYVQFVFNKDGDFSYARNISFSENLTQEDMDRISIGMHLKTVLQLDPQGAYDFLYTGSNVSPKISNHYLSSGIYYRIVYDDNLNVIRIEKKVL